jgi:hypothetical protein
MKDDDGLVSGERNYVGQYVMYVLIVDSLKERIFI